MSGGTLHWDASYEIVLALMERHPDVDVSSVGIQQLKQMIVDLPEFEDDPMLANDRMLNDILREWYEETTA